MKDYQKKIADALGDDIIKFARFALESSNADMLRACVDCYFKIYERFAVVDDAFCLLTGGRLAMGEHNKHEQQSAPAKPEGKLVAIQFAPGISVSLGGKHTSMTFWSREKLVDSQQSQDRVHVEERRDGSIRVSTADGFVRIVEPWAVAWRMYEPEGRK